MAVNVPMLEVQQGTTWLSSVVLWDYLLVGQGSRTRQKHTLEPVCKILVHGDKSTNVTGQGPQSEGCVKDGRIKEDFF